MNKALGFIVLVLWFLTFFFMGVGAAALITGCAAPEKKPEPKLVHPEKSPTWVDEYAPDSTPEELQRILARQRRAPWIN